MKEEIVLTDVTSTYYKIVSASTDQKDKRYRNLEDAINDANKQNGRVVKVIKRLKETLEFEAIKEAVLE